MPPHINDLMHVPPRRTRPRKTFVDAWYGFGRFLAATIVTMRNACSMIGQRTSGSSNSSYRTNEVVADNQTYRSTEHCPKLLDITMPTTIIIVLIRDTILMFLNIF